MPEQGTLIVCGTPIGNLGDVSDRLRETLGSADVVFAEDTRRTATLLRHVGATPPVRSLFVGNEAARSDEVLTLLEQGKTVALVSDAGMPGVSDPGSDVVRSARAGGHVVTVVPGPSAVTAAAAAAGFGADRFVFEGFLPRKGQERRRRLEVIAAEIRPVVLFVSPHRFQSDLADIAESTGPDRMLFIGRELTKLHEETWVGSIGDAVAVWADREAKGEFTLVIAPAAPTEPSLDEAIATARRLMSEGSSASDAARFAARDTGVARRPIYESLISHQEPS